MDHLLRNSQNLLHLTSSWQILSEQTNQLFININKKNTQHISEVAEVAITTSKEKKNPNLTSKHSSK